MIPHSKEIERVVLACALNDPEALAVICERASEENFYDPTHLLFFRSIFALFADGSAVDVVTLGDFLEGSINRCQIVELATSFATSANIDHYLTRLKELTLRRNLYFEGDRLKLLATDSNVTSELAVNEACNRLISLQNDCGCDNAQEGIMDIANGWLDPERKVWFKSGMEQWDKHMYGWHPGMWYIVAADQNVGKSAWAQNVFLKALKHNEDLAGLYFTYDDDVPPTLARMVSCLCGGSLTISQVEELHKQEDHQIQRVLTVLDGFKRRMDDGSLAIYGNSHTDVSQILSAIKKMKKDTGKMVMVVIDSVQHVCVGGKNDSGATEGVTSLSKAIHRLTKTEQVIMVTTSQINKCPMHFDRQSNRWVKRLPTIDDMPYGKQLAFDAAWVGLMTQDRVEPVKMINYKQWYHNRMYVAKNKTGPFKDSCIHYVMDGECCQVEEG